MPLKSCTSSRRGDTIIEVMFAFAIFTMVAIVSVMIMNSGIAASERSLELVTARNELNAQAEALRFIHSSYIAEMNLPECTDGGNVAANGDKCQQYKGLWEEITSGARLSASNTSEDRYSIPSPITRCQEVYEEKDGHRNLLYQNNAFVINTRELLSENNISASIVRANSANGNSIFIEPPLGARILYGSSLSNDTSADHMSDSGMLVSYTDLLRAEGIWVVAVEGPRQTSTSTAPQYYDFYIDTCWYGSGASSPTTLDAVVRLYNPQGS